MRLARQAVSFAHKRHTVHNFKVCAHLVLAVAITSGWTTCHLEDCLGNTTLLENGLEIQREDGVKEEVHS